MVVFKEMEMSTFKQSSGRLAIEATFPSGWRQKRMREIGIARRICSARSLSPVIGVKIEKTTRHHMVD